MSRLDPSAQNDRMYNKQMVEQREAERRSMLLDQKRATLKITQMQQSKRDLSYDAPDAKQPALQYF